MHKLIFSCILIFIFRFTNAQDINFLMYPNTFGDKYVKENYLQRYQLSNDVEIFRNSMSGIRTYYTESLNELFNFYTGNDYNDYIAEKNRKDAGIKSIVYNHTTYTLTYFYNQSVDSLIIDDYKKDEKKHNLKYESIDFWKDSIKQYNFYYFVSHKNQMYDKRIMELLHRNNDSIVFDKNNRIIYVKDGGRIFQFSENTVLSSLGSIYKYDSLGRMINNYIVDKNGDVEQNMVYSYSNKKLDSISIFNMNYEDPISHSIKNGVLIYRRTADYRPDGSMKITDYYKDFDTEDMMTIAWRKERHTGMPDYSAIISYTYNKKNQLTEKVIRDRQMRLYYQPNGNFDKIEEYFLQDSLPSLLLYTHKFHYKDTLIQKIDLVLPCSELFLENGVLKRLSSYTEYEVFRDENKRLIKFVFNTLDERKINTQRNKEIITVKQLKPENYTFTYDRKGFVSEYYAVDRKSSNWKITYFDDK